jgi:two-component system chemotaxis sensor kinase CheA
MKEADLTKYRGIFISETREYLSQLTQYIIELEKEPGKSETIDAIFRNFHTIKGMAGTMGYKVMESLSHSLEDLLSLIRNGDIAVTSDVIDIMLEGNDAIDYLIDHPDAVEGDIGELVERISTFEKSEVRMAKRRPQVEKSNSVMCTITLDKTSPFKGARAVVLMSHIEKMAEIAQYFPSKEAIINGNFDVRFSLSIIPREPLNTIETSLEGFSDVESVLFEEEKPSKIKKVVSKKSDIRVEIKKLDNLQNLLSELVIAKESLKRVAQTNDRESVLNETERISSIISNLQDEVVKIRMVPIWQVFERFPRVVRDTAKELGKEVDFDIQGKDIELDRSMLENLAEPLIHLLRNSLYHGIESVEERKRLGKPERGSLVLEATRQRGIVLIRVIDDGRGMDVEKILIKAIERGLVSPEKASTLSEKEILNFVFMSGFSTSEVVDEVSGRGVGLDVVKTTLRKLGGTFDYKTERGKGTTFVLKVPLTMAIIKAFLVHVGEEVYAIPLTFVEETIELNSQLIRSIHSKELFVLRDEVIPVKRLHEIFGAQNGERKDFYPAVIVNSESRKAAFITSDFLEHTDVVVKTLPRTHADIKEFAGVTLLSDGTPALIIDVTNII